MKRTIFGVMLMIFGAVMFVAATTLFAVSAQSSDEYFSETSAAAAAEKVENKVYIGEYYLNGDTEKDCIYISDGSVTFSDGTVKDYTLSVWKNMPETDEKSGYINYVDYCFLKIGSDKVSYDPAAKEILFDDAVYAMVG